jgi:hypothetical protein
MMPVLLMLASIHYLLAVCNTSGVGWHTPQRLIEAGGVIVLYRKGDFDEDVYLFA